MVTFGSLFAGIGGFDLGFERAGMFCKWQVEIDRYANRVLSKRWPNVRRWGDVHQWPQSDTEYVDVICGGDPCQENSNARQGIGCESPSLGGEFIRIVDAMRPRFVVRENPSVVRADAPWPWFRFRGELESIGYVVMPFRLRACCLGLDHRRDRLLLLAELPNAMQAGSQGDVFEKVERQTGGKGRRDTTRQAGWDATPRICGVSDGIPNRMDRLRGLGNAVPPAMAEWIGRRIVSVMQGVA